MIYTVDVAVRDATIYYDKLYTYALPIEFVEHTFAGSIVLVPFGRGNSRARIGIVLSIEEQVDIDKKTKMVYDVAPEKAMLTAELLGIVKYLKETTFCTWYEAVKTVLPFGAQYKAVKTEDGWILQQQLKQYTEKVYTICETVIEQIYQQINVTPDEQIEHLFVHDKKISKKQTLVLLYLAKGPQKQADILSHCGITRGVLDTLQKHGYIQAENTDKVLPVGPYVKETMPCIKLTSEQETISKALCDKSDQNEYTPSLLYGVTSSGKTLIFVDIISHVLKQGKTAVVLVPEISLAPQMIRRLRAHFGDLVAVQHSRLSNTERLLQWQQIKRGEAKVVVGTRSAIFAPLYDIGVIIVDEEQERTYQSESSPRYNALDIAKWRAAYHHTVVIFSSATPLITDYYAAIQGKYHLYTLTERYGHLPLPEVDIIDMNEERMKGNLSTSLSEPLLQAIAKEIAEKKQVILLLNKRGYQRIAMCRDCHEVIKCNHCSVPMVYHKKENKLLCHYCGNSLVPAPTKCPLCTGELRYTGFGTQRVEEELQTYIQQIRIVRMDTDSTNTKHAHENFLNEFGKGEYDLLLGTQMVAKGLDFENVSLVGVLGIDSLLFGQGYRCAETVFSLITQVIGRSGRKNSGAKAIIQTSDPHNDVLKLAAQQNYEDFYEEEIAIRKLALYPPFCSICMVGFVAHKEEDALYMASYFSKLLAQNANKKDDLPLRILGPAPMNILQIGGRFRYRITLKCKNNKVFRELLRTTLQQIYEKKMTPKTNIFVDFNAISDV